MLQILKRARGPNDGDITSFGDTSDKDEINRRTWKAGYTDRDGQMKVSRSGAGKGDVYRPCNKKLYDENYERIFGKK